MITKGFVYKGKFISFVERLRSPMPLMGIPVIRMHYSPGKTMLYMCSGQDDYERKMKVWEPLCYDTVEQYRQAEEMRKFDHKLLYRGFAVNDVVTVKQTQNAYYTGSFNPGSLYIIKAFPPKACSTQEDRDRMCDKLEHFAYLETEDGTLTGGVHLCNLELVHRPGRVGKVV